MRRPLFSEGGPVVLLRQTRRPRAERHLDLTFGTTVRAVGSGRSRRAHDRRRSLLPANGRAYRDTRCPSPIELGLRVAIRMLGSSARPVSHEAYPSCRPPVVRGTNRCPVLQPGGGRGNESLARVLGSRLDCRKVDGRRVLRALSRSEGVPKSAATRDRSRGPRQIGARSRAADASREAQPPSRLPEGQKSPGERATETTPRWSDSAGGGSG
jgi:hypothetical protein